MASQGSFPSEVQDRVKRGYLERLDRRVKRMRRLYSERNWQDLRVECLHLRNTATAFGFSKLALLAEQVETSFPKGELSRATVVPEVREATESLFHAIDHVLIADSLDRF